jgi:trimethylamine--corrinoid protein Co-methyltransferase
MSMLRNADVERIIAGAYDLLATTGVKVIHEEALQILSDHGARVDFSARTATIPQNLVEKCLKTVPSSLEFYNFEGEKSLSVEGDTVNFVLDSAPVFVLDSETQKIRSAKTRDMVEIIKLADNLGHVPCMTASVVPEDVPISLCDVIRFHQALIYSSKPVFGGAFSIDGLLIEIELLSALAGSKDEIFERTREKKHEILRTYKAPAIAAHTRDEMKHILTEYAAKKGEKIPEFIFEYLTN